MYNVEHFDNDLYFLCSMIEYVGRETHNKRIDIVKEIGFDNLKHEYICACVNHCLPVEQVCAEWIEDYKIEPGTFDNLATVDGIETPDFWSIGDVYMSLILNTLDYEYNAKDSESNSDHDSLIKHLIEVYGSPLAKVIDDYNNIVFTKSPMYLWDCYIKSEILDF